MHLYSPIPHPYRHDLLAAIGAPERPGTFEPIGAWQDALSALAGHKVAAVDPVPWPFLGPVWWALKRVPGALIGPAILFDRDAIQPEQLPAGGLEVAQVVDSYIRAVPGAVARRIRFGGDVPRTDLMKRLRALVAAEPRIAVQRYRNAPRLWHRTVTAPRLRGAGELEDWIGREKALPSGPALFRWYSQVRAEQWHRRAIGRLVDSLVAGELSAWDGKEQIPNSWWESDLELDVQTGAIYGPNDRHRPLATALQLYREGEQPAAVAVRERIMAAGGPRVVISQAIAEHHAVLTRLPDRSAQLDFLLSALPGVNRGALTVGLRLEFGAAKPGPKRKAQAAPKRRGRPPGSKKRAPALAEIATAAAA